MMRTTRMKMVAATAVVSCLGLVGCSSENEPRDADASAGEASGEASEDAGDPSDGDDGPALPPAPEADLDGIPDVVAEVNGEEISLDEFVTAYEAQFQQQAAQAQATGQEVDQDALKQETADALVGTLLLVQAADERGLDASDERVEETLQELAESSGLPSVDALVGALGEQGLSEAEVLDQVATQVRIDQLVAEEVGDLEPTRAEVRAAYDAAVAQQEQTGADELPPFDRVRPQVADQVRSENEARATLALVEQLREDGDVSINL